MAICPLFVLAYPDDEERQICDEEECGWYTEYSLPTNLKGDTKVNMSMCSIAVIGYKLIDTNRF